MVTVIVRQRKKKPVIVEQKKEPVKTEKKKQKKKHEKKKHEKKLNAIENAILKLNNKRSELFKILDIVKPDLLKIGVYPWSFQKIKDLIYHQENIITTHKYLSCYMHGTNKELLERSKTLKEMQYHRENLFYPECWVKIVNKKAIPVKMPFVYVVQMLVNWEYKRKGLGFGAVTYWQKNRDSFIMHSDTVKYIEDHIVVFNIFDS